MPGFDGTGPKGQGPGAGQVQPLGGTMEFSTVLVGKEGRVGIITLNAT